jgi:hypothetical protein
MLNNWCLLELLRHWCECGNVFIIIIGWHQFAVVPFVSILRGCYGGKLVDFCVILKSVYVKGQCSSVIQSFFGEYAFLAGGVEIFIMVFTSSVSAETIVSFRWQTLPRHMRSLDHILVLYWRNKITATVVIWAWSIFS